MKYTLVTGKDIKISLFYADFCQHSIKFMSEWKKIKDELSKDINANISFSEYEISKNNIDFINKNVNAVPTIKIQIDGLIKEYTGKTKEGLVEHILSWNNDDLSIFN